MRILTASLCRIVNAYQLHKLLHPVINLFPGQPLFLISLLLLHNLRDLVSNGHSRIQRRHGILKHHGKTAAPQSAHFSFRIARDIFPIQQDLSGFLLCGCRKQLHNTAAQRAFSAAGFSHQSKDFSFFQ